MLGLVLLGVGALGLYLLRYYTAAQLGVTGDDARYLVLAESFLKGQPYRIISFPSAPLETIWPPGYPLFVLAPVALFTGMDYELLRGVSVILTCGSVFLAFALAKCYLPGVVPAFLVTAMFALNHWTAGLAGSAMSEAAFVFFVLLHLLLLSRWTAEGGALRRRVYVLPVLALTLAVAALTRYQGIALALASVAYLAVNRRYRSAAGLAVGFVLLIMPFAVFLRLNSIESPTSLFAVQMISDQLAWLWRLLPQSLWSYATAAPLVMIPVLGPRAVDLLANSGLGWLATGLHLVLFVLTAWGTIRGLLNRELPAIYLAAYFALILVVANQGTASRNEGRYTAAALPFLYLCFYKGVVAVGASLRVRERTIRRAAALMCGVIVLVLLARNVQQARAEFQVPDLATGADWVQRNAVEDAVIMTHDPVERYLYLRRHTVALLAESYDRLTADGPDRTEADYILVAPPLRTRDQQANRALELDPRDAEWLLPSLRAEPQRFKMVWEDPSAKAYLFEVLAPEDPGS
jgi:hypothetical protein